MRQPTACYSVAAALAALVTAVGCEKSPEAYSVDAHQPPSESRPADDAKATNMVSLAADVKAAEVKIGDAAPGFSGVVGTDDKRHDLGEYGDAKLVVLVFTCNHCPVAQRL